MFFDQQEFDIRCEWGEQGVAALASISDAVIIVDVLSFFDQCGDSRAQRRNSLPLSLADDRAVGFVASVDAILAEPR